MNEFMQYLVHGVLLGVTYGLIALPLGLTHTAIGIVDAAVGAYATLAGIVAVAVGGAVGLAVGVGAGIAAALLVGLIYQLLVKRGVADPIIVVAATFGVGLALQSVILTRFGADPRITQIFDESLAVGPVRVNPQSLINLAIGAGLVVTMLLLIQRTSVGRQIRASADNLAGALLTGIPVVRLQYLVFGIEGLLAGVAGILLAYTTGLDFTSCVTLTLSAFGAVIIFGVRGPLACFFGGLVIGTVEALVAGYVPGGMLTALPYLFVLAVLVFVPQHTQAARP